MRMRKWTIGSALAAGLLVLSAMSLTALAETVDNPESRIIVIGGGVPTAWAGPGAQAENTGAGPVSQTTAAGTDAQTTAAGPGEQAAAAGQEAQETASGQGTPAGVTGSDVNSQAAMETQPVMQATSAGQTFSARPRKSMEELQAVMAEVPAGPAKAEWGTFFLGNNLPPQNDENEAYLRAFHAYAMVPGEEKSVYLTFDEGYENGYTPVILDILAKHNVKAAFFCTGSFVRESPELVRRFAQEGHIIGNHTLTHPSMMSVDNWAEFSRQLLSVEDLVKDVTGTDMPRYYRPPAGAYSEAQLRMADAMGFRTVFWSVAYKDWDTSAQPTHERAMNYLTTRIHPGAIVLLHAVSKTNAEILDELLTRWEQMGYTFKTLDELPEGLTE